MFGCSDSPAASVGKVVGFGADREIQVSTFFRIGPNSEVEDEVRQYAVAHRRRLRSWIVNRRSGRTLALPYPQVL